MDGAMAGTTKFEILLDRALRENAEAMFKVNIGDSHMHAMVKGQRLGLERAAELFKKCHETDQDDA